MKDCLPGSSPRMRGKPHRLLRALLGLGLIPAYAGKTFLPMKRFRGQGAHPRVCGENPQRFMTASIIEGSSPRMRGKRRAECLRAPELGLIPAYAGKTGHEGKTLPLRGAHPRVCGENPERSGVLTLRSVRSWKTLSFPSSLKVTHCRAFVQLSLSRIRL